MKQLYELNSTIKTVMALLIYFSVCKPVVSVKTACSFAGLQSVCYKYIYINSKCPRVNSFLSKISLIKYFDSLGLHMFLYYLNRPGEQLLVAR